MAAEPEFTTGMRELDELIGGIRGPYMLLIVGHPGAGKSTLASQICYVNALKGHKCLYMSFYESKEKLFRNVAKLGINLVEAENKGLLVHVKLPVAATQEVLDTISRLVTKDSYRVVVVDSINPLMDFLKRKEQRAILLNFFYNLVDAISGLLVVVSEVPLGKEALSLGSIEFVADAIVYLKHRVSRGLVTRILEIRKVRGAPLTVVEA
ncbi:MAG: ATPase domain-containing protein, partial [Desulfurococcaceae archaeon]